jgi:hypothetical protein
LKHLLFYIFIYKIKMSLVLPNRALLLIHDYSRPMTHPDWRKSKPIISTYRLYTRVIVLKNLHTIILHNIYQTDWYYAFYYIKYHGLSTYARDYLNTTRVINMEGIEEAIYYYENE